MPNCLHGMDARFCATCTKPMAAIPKTTLEEVLWCLNEVKLRATYGAVAGCIGVIAQAMGNDRLGTRRPEASWVVKANSGFPEGYLQSEMHPDLFRSRTVLSSAPELMDTIVRWRASRRT